MKRPFTVIFIVGMCFIMSEHEYAFSYPKFSNASAQKMEGFHFSRSSCPNSEIELGFQFSASHSPGNKFKKLTNSLPLSFTTFNYNLFYQVTGVISLQTYFIPTSRLLIFPFHNFW
jgi:hypothetical protein